MTTPARFSVLVVDDEPSVLVTYLLILQQQGYDVTAVATSAEALQALSRRSFRLLLCDLSLERQQDGFEVIAAARARCPATRCVLLTGFAGKDVGDRALQQGVTVLFKPIEIEEFLRIIARLAQEK
jgi:CheY-like chemotaxis protein